MARVDLVKWIATVIQLIGYGLTGLNIVPWNVFAFIVGIILWFTVGVMWKGPGDYGGACRGIHRDCRRISEFVMGFRAIIDQFSGSLGVFLMR